MVLFLLKLNRQKSSEVTRIVYLGGSSTAGTGAELADESTWPYKVNEILNKKNIKVDYINGALGGYTSFESYGRLWSRIRDSFPQTLLL